MNKINREWHEKNRMPKNATVDERVRWHREHLKNCECRKDVPASLKEYFKAK